MRGEWIEMIISKEFLNCIPSLPMRGEWIEIGFGVRFFFELFVSPHAGRVD